VVENFRPYVEYVVSRHRLRYVSPASIRPRPDLIGRISGFGQDWPYRDFVRVY